ncbi:MAG TPA: lysylphosphatidylglycerol synthase transmembrane domain-containing protein [Thermoanaerobaculia bacterium]|nr:lysylphosphatidylglycerol synthase transmembrane domain-containing protein [Thermoanaerobaculia bacterium]
MAEPTDKASPLGRRFAMGAAQVAILALLAWLAWWYVRGLDLELLRTRLEEIGAGYLVLMVAGLLARLPVWNARWLVGVRRAGLDARWWRSMGALAASMAVNSVTPTARVAGGLVRARFLAADTQRGFGVAYGTVLVDQFVHHAGVGIFSFVAVSSTVGHRIPRWVVVLTAVAAVACVLALWSSGRGSDGGSPGRLDRLVAAMRRRLEKQATRQPRLGAALSGGGDAIEIVSRLMRDPVVLGYGALYSAVFFALGGCVQWLACRALGLPVGFLEALAVVGIGGIAGVAAGTPGGAGGAEAGMIATLTLLGVSSVDATVAALLFRGLHYTVVLGVGLPFLAILEWSVRREA